MNTIRVVEYRIGNNIYSFSIGQPLTIPVDQNDKNSKGVPATVSMINVFLHESGIREVEVYVTLNTVQNQVREYHKALLGMNAEVSTKHDSLIGGY